MKVCPAGWHLPSQKGLNSLANLGAKALWDSSFAGGDDPYGFAALPVGAYYIYTKSYYHFGKSAYFWSKTSADDYNAYYMNISTNVLISSSGTTYYTYSVRCVKN